MTKEDEFNIREPLPDSSYDIEEILPQIAEELRTRLTTTLSERDELAVKTALIKAAVRGVQRGMAHHTAQVNKRLAADLTAETERFEAEFRDFGAEYDPWAEQYGPA